MDSLISCFRSWYVVAEDLNICGYVVPKGFISDGCSCPHILKRWFSSDEILLASILHDYLYYKKVGFVYSNKIFYKTLMYLNVSYLKATLMFVTVSLFGYLRYK